MEDFDNIFQQNNPVAIVQAITKLTTIIKQKTLTCETVKHSENVILELQLLKSKCGDANPIVSLTASQGILKLVEDGSLPIGATISDLILTLSTARYISEYKQILCL